MIMRQFFYAVRPRDSMLNSTDLNNPLIFQFTYDMINDKRSYHEYNIKNFIIISPNNYGDKSIYDHK